MRIFKYILTAVAAEVKQRIKNSWAGTIIDEARESGNYCSNLALFHEISVARVILVTLAHSGGACMCENACI